MNEETKNRLTEWSAKLGIPVEALFPQFDEEVAMFKRSVPGKTEEWYEDAARHRIYLSIKSDLKSPARAFDVVFVGQGSTMDVNREEMEEKKLLWQNPQTREQAVAEGKVYRYNPALGPRMTTRDRQGNAVEVPDGIPLDTREWMIPPNKETGEKGRKNRNLGKPLLPAIIRNYVGFGRPAIGGPLKIISLTGVGEQRVKLIPPRGKPVRVRMNVRNETPMRFDCNMATPTRFDQPVVMPEIPDEGTLLQLMGTCPLRKSIADVPAFHKEHEKDTRRVVIVEGDASYVSDEPTNVGSYIVVLEDTSREDLEAEGLTVFTPEKPDFGRNSRVYAIGRTTIGPGRNPETGEFDQKIEKVNLNAVGIWAIPEFRVAPEEESVIAAEPVK